MVSYQIARIIYCSDPASQHAVSRTLSPIFPCPPLPLPSPSPTAPPPPTPLLVPDKPFSLPAFSFNASNWGLWLAKQLQQAFALWRVPERRFTYAFYRLAVWMLWQSWFCAGGYSCRTLVHSLTRRDSEILLEVRVSIFLLLTTRNWHRWPSHLDTYSESEDWETPAKLEGEGQRRPASRSVVLSCSIAVADCCFLPGGRARREWSPSRA